MKSEWSKGVFVRKSWKSSFCGGLERNLCLGGDLGWKESFSLVWRQEEQDRNEKEVAETLS